MDGAMDFKPLKVVPKYVLEYAKDSLENNDGNPVTGSKWYKDKIKTLLADSQMELPWTNLINVLDQEQVLSLVLHVTGIIPFRWIRFSKERSSEFVELLELSNHDESSEEVLYYIANRPSESSRKDIISEIHKLSVKLDQIAKNYPTIVMEIMNAEPSLSGVFGGVSALQSVALKHLKSDRSDLHEIVALTMPKKNVENAETIHFHRELSKLFYSLTGKPHCELVADITNGMFALGIENQVSGDDVKKAFQTMKNKGKI